METKEAVKTIDTSENSGESGQNAAAEPPEPTEEEPRPASVADTVLLGRDLRTALKPPFRQLKSKKPLPKPAKPGMCQMCAETRAAATYEESVKSGRSRAASSAVTKKPKLKIRCLHKFSAGCSERITFMAKPSPRFVAHMLEDYGKYLPTYKVQRLQDLIIGETHFVPAQAYDYFVHVRQAARVTRRMRRKQACAMKKEALQSDNCSWTRNAVVVFARSLQKRLLHPVQYQLSGGMLRLSNIILDELCCYMHMRTPARCDSRPKCRFMVSVADTIVAWIDQILADANRRIVLIDVEDDDDIVDPTPCSEEFPRPETSMPKEPVVREGAAVDAAGTESAPKPPPEPAPTPSQQS